MKKINLFLVWRTIVQWFELKAWALRRWYYRRNRFLHSKTTTTTAAESVPSFYSPESTLTLEKMKAAIRGIEKPVYSNLVVNSFESIEKYLPQYKDPPHLLTREDGLGITLGGMRVTPSPYMPANRALAIGTVCRDCGRSIRSPVPCSDGHMMHQPEMILVVLEEEHDEKKDNT